MKIIIRLLCVLIVFPSCLIAQDSFKDRFAEGNMLMEDKFYQLALPVWLELLQENPENANINYKAGICHFYASSKREKSLPFLEKAALKATSNYDMFSHEEQKAKLDVHYYLGRAYHLSYKLDKASESYRKFIDEAGKRHYLVPETHRQLQMVENARELMQNPINIRISNLGKEINSPYPEYSPVVSLDESTIYYTSRRLRPDSSNRGFTDVQDGMYYEDIYVAYKAEGKHTWMEPELLNINRINKHIATIGLSADGQTLYMYMDDDGVGNLFKSRLEGEIWTSPEALGSDINTNSQETHVTVSADDRTLYFVSDRKGGQGGKDIWRSVRLPNGQWSKALNLGPAINTPHDEDGCFIHPDGKTLYFSSKGHNSMGGYDIFYSELEDNEQWTVPENIGYPINTTDDDVFYITSPDGTRAYYSSNKEGGSGEKDIYLIEQVEAVEKALTLVKGHIVAPDGEELPDDLLIVVTDNETGELVGRYRPLKRNGSFTLIIPPGKNYNLSYINDEEEFFNENIYVPFGSEYQEISKDIMLPSVSIAGDVIPKAGEEELAEKKWMMKFSNLNKELPPDLTMAFLDDKNQLLFKEQADEEGNFRFKELPAEFSTLKLEGAAAVDCEKLGISLLNVEDNKEVTLIVNEDCSFQIMEKKTPAAKEFQQFFGYNVKEIDVNSAEFKSFISEIAAIVKEKGNISITIESSASKVPTRTFGSNDKLTKLRAEEAKKILIKTLNSNGVNKEKVTVANMQTLVQGPKYRGDFDTNKSTYLKFQYVKILVN